MSCYVKLGGLGGLGALQMNCDTTCDSLQSLCYLVLALDLVGRVLDVTVQKIGRDCVHGQVMVDKQLRPNMDGCNGVQGVVCGVSMVAMVRNPCLLWCLGP